MTAPLLVRIDNRLVHGQVLEAWVPELKLAALTVADDEAAGDALARMAMGLAMGPHLQLEILTLAQAAEKLRGAAPSQPERTMLLLREVQSAVALTRMGVPIARLNLGNVHFRPGRKQAAPTLYLDAAELSALEALAASGTQIEWRAVPADAPLSLAALRARHDQI